MNSDSKRSDSNYLLDKPCPFCGRADLIYVSIPYGNSVEMVSCHACGCEGPYPRDDQLENSDLTWSQWVVRLWNTRANRDDRSGERHAKNAKDASVHPVMFRIAEALDRIAKALEQNPPEPLKRSSPSPSGYINPQWVEQAKRVIAGEKVKHIADSLSVSPPAVRQNVLKVFKRRNSERYVELKGGHDYGCRTEPSMRSLVKHANEFGFMNSEPTDDQKRRNEHE